MLAEPAGQLVKVAEPLSSGSLQPEGRLPRGNPDSVPFDQNAVLLINPSSARRQIVRRAIRIFVLAEAVTFLAAALVHFGVLLGGYEHRAAGTAETVIGTVLLLGLLSTGILPDSTRGIGLAVQAFALFGTFVGITTIAVGIGPRTVPDVAYHILISIALICGLVVTFQSHVPATQPGA